MANERITESIVREHFRKDPLFEVIRLEEQKSKNNKVAALLKSASKSGKGIGKPEFIVSFPSQNINYIIVIECKASIHNHSSPNFDKPKDYAVDGVLHYARILSKDYTVIAVAVSGQNENELKVSTYKWIKNQSKQENLNTNYLLSVTDYLKLFDNEDFSENLKNVDIIQKAIHLNEEFHSYSITEYTRCTIVSAILLSLLDNPFKSSYATHETTHELAEEMLQALKRVLNKRDEDNKYFVRNKDSMLKEFDKITNEPIFRQSKIKRKKEEKITIQVFKEDFIDYLYKNVFPLITMDDAGIDILGKFYTEFIRYAGSSQKQGIVLTPFHVTEFFCDLANITENSIIYDPCCGSGGFLISAMKRMLILAGNDSEKKNNIKKNQLIGVERRPDMFTYACTNMMFRGDGKSNIYNGDCFNLESKIKSNHSPNTVFLNPPYDVGNAGQMEFIEHGLRMVSKNNGTVVAIVQVSCAIKNEKELIAVKERLLKSHRLLAVISVPDDLFYPIGVVTCIMVFKANIPNQGFETWFGYLKDDGFEKRKHKGRLDIKKKWAGIRTDFIRAYKNSREIPGFSVKKEVNSKNEWVAEAYLETDYSILEKRHFERIIMDYMSFKVKIEYTNIDVNPLINDTVEFDTNNWKVFQFKKIFDIENGYYNKKPEHTEKGSIPFIGATDSNNGVTAYYSLFDIETYNKDSRSIDHPLERKIFKGNCITVSNNGSVGYAFYQEKDFTCSHDVNVLYLRGRGWNKYIAMFICTLIGMERYRWAYGRKWRPSRMPDSEIKLPVNKDGEPDWEFMEHYIKSLPYSKNLEEEKSNHEKSIYKMSFNEIMRRGIRVQPPKDKD